MNKLSLLLLSSSFALSLTACDSTDDESETQAATATEGSSDTDATTGSVDTSAGTDDPSGGTDDPSGGTDDPSGGTDDPSGGTDDPTGSGAGACVYQCSVDEDCLSDGTDLGFSCTDNGICLNVCENDGECVAQFSGWSFQPCDNNEACAAGPCIDLGDGTGGCGTEPTEFVDCATIMQAEVEVTDIDGATVTVCGNDSGVCSDIGDGDMTCLLDVEPPTCEDTGCAEGFTCDATDGVCRCDDDNACSALGDDYTCGDDGLCTAPGCVDASECDADLPFDGGSYECI